MLACHRRRRRRNKYRLFSQLILCSGISKAILDQSNLAPVSLGTGVTSICQRRVGKKSNPLFLSTM